MAKKKESYFKGRVHASTKKQTKSGGFGYLKLPDGISSLVFDDKVKSVKLDLMPYIVTDPKHPDKDLGAQVGFPWYRRPFKLHRDVGVKHKSFICPTSIGKKCPICEYQTELFKTDKEGAIKLYPKSRDLYAPIPLDSKKHEAVPVFVWDMAESLFNDELDAALEKDPDMEIFPDLEDGKTLDCDIKWKTIVGSKPYPEIKHISFEDRDEAYAESIMDDIPDLDAIIKESVLSYEELKAVFFEMEDEDDAGEIKEDEEEEDEEEEDEEDEKPVRKKTIIAKPSRKVVEDEDEEDEEEEEKPVKKTMRTTGKPLTKTKAPVIADEEDEDDDIDIPVKERCIACQGTGKNSKGRECIICEGTGRNPKFKEKSGIRACPHDHKFGVDSEKFDDCDECKVWSACADAKDKLNKK